MSTIRYIISDASKRIDVEPHVLRYWEEELDLEIPRNEMGHRYYRDQEIETLKLVKGLKEQGFQLKAIKMILPDISKIETLDPQKMLELKEELNEKATELENEERSLQANSETSSSANKSHHEVNRLSKDHALDNMTAKTNHIEVETPIDSKMGQFRLIMGNLITSALKENNENLTEALSTAVSDNVIKEMDYLLRIKEEREEERYKRLDETIRDYQKLRQESAATSEKTPKKRRFFKKNKA